MRDVTLGDPADVSIAGLKVLLSEGTSYINVSRELRAARLRAAEALEKAGAIVDTVPLKSMKKALELYLAVLKLEAGVNVTQLTRTRARRASRCEGPASARARTRARCACCS